MWLDITSNSKTHMEEIVSKTKGRDGGIIGTMDGQNSQNNMPPPQVNKQPQENKVDLEEALAQMLTSHTTFMNETKTNIQNQST